MRVQDLAVVVLLMLIPLLAPSPDSAQSGGFARIAQALGAYDLQAWACVCARAWLPASQHVLRWTCLLQRGGHVCRKRVAQQACITCVCKSVSVLGALRGGRATRPCTPFLSTRLHRHMLPQCVQLVVVCASFLACMLRGGSAAGGFGGGGAFE